MLPMESLMALAASTSFSLGMTPASQAPRTVCMSSVPVMPSVTVEASTPCSRERTTVSGRLMASLTAPSSARSASEPT